MHLCVVWIQDEHLEITHHIHFPPSGNVKTLLTFHQLAVNVSSIRSAACTESYMKGGSISSTGINPLFWGKIASPDAL